MCHSELVSPKESFGQNLNHRLIAQNPDPDPPAGGQDDMRGFAKGSENKIATGINDTDGNR